MEFIKQSFAWWCFAQRDLPPPRLVQAAAEIGYSGIDLIDRKYWKLARDYGLEIATIKGHQSIDAGLNRREHHYQIEQEMLANIELAVKWQIPNLICYSGNRDGLDDLAGLQVTAEGLLRLAPAVEAAGVNLFLELINSKVDRKDYQCDRTLWGVQVCQLVESPRVKLLYDIYHMQIMEGDIIRTISTYHHYFGHYHTAGNPGRGEIDDTQELNYPAIVRAIQATDYNGYIGHEFTPRADPLIALRRAFDICNSR